MSELSRRIKKLVSPWPRLSAVLSALYHAVNFRRIAIARLRMYEQQLRLHRYFESVYQAELSYLRGHCRYLEKEVAAQHTSAPLALFPAVPTEMYRVQGESSAHVKHYKVKM